MVTEFGMSEMLGAVNYNGHKRNAFLDTPFMQERGNYSEDTALKIDSEVKRIVGEATNTAREVLRERRDHPRRAVRAPAREGSDRIGGAQGDHGAAADEGPRRRAGRDTAARACARCFLMPTRTESESFEDILEHLRQMRGFDFTAYKRASLMRRVVKRMHSVERRDVRGLPRLSAGAPGRVRGALQHHPHQRHVVLSRPRRLGLRSTHDSAAACWRSSRAPRAHPRLERRMRVGPGGLQRRNAAGRSARSRCSSRERVKIYATDVDDEALREARRRPTRRGKWRTCPPPLLEKYFDRNGEIALPSTGTCGGR